MFSQLRRQRNPNSNRGHKRLHWKPYLESLEARSLLRGGFTDGFEGATLDPFWSTYTQSGSIQLTTAMAHSGSQSVEFSSTQTSLSKYVNLFHNFSSPTYGVTSVWVYDTGAGVDSSNYIDFEISNTSVGFGSELGTQDYDLPGNGDTYDYSYSAPPVASSGSTGISRTQAWHQFEFADTPQSFSLLIDGTTVYTQAGGTPFTQVLLNMSGPDWDPAWTTYFDDFTYTPSQSVYPTSINWGQYGVPGYKPVNGYVDGVTTYTYNVVGTLSQDVPVALYWSPTAAFCSNTATVVYGTGSTIPSMTTAGSHPGYVNDDLLTGSPDGTQYLLVVVGDPNSQGFDPTQDEMSAQLSLNVPPVSQGDGRWASKDLDGMPGETIQRYGCADGARHGA